MTNKPALLQHGTLKDMILFSSIALMIMLPKYQPSHYLHVCS